MMHIHIRNHAGKGNLPQSSPALIKLTSAILCGLGVLVTAFQAQAQNLRVITTIKPLHALASQVLEGVAEPKLLIDGAQSPHVFALKPSDASALHQAHLFLRVGPTIEPFSEKVRASLPSSVKVLSALEVDGLSLLPLRQSGAYEAHDHGQDHGHHHDGHDHHDKDAKPQASSQALDPHIWLDPTNAAHVVKALVRELKEIAPHHATTLDRNGEAALQRLTKLGAELSTTLAPVRSKPFIVFHDAFQYFEKRFGLSGAGAITLHPEVPLSGKRLQEMRKTIRTAGVTCVFSEPQFNANRVATVAEGTGVQVGVLDPLGAKTPKGSDAYDVMMRALAASFVTCLNR